MTVDSAADKPRASLPAGPRLTIVRGYGAIEECPRRKLPAHPAAVSPGSLPTRRNLLTCRKISPAPARLPGDKPECAAAAPSFWASDAPAAESSSHPPGHPPHSARSCSLPDLVPWSSV